MRKHTPGRRRAQLAFGLLGGLACAAAMALILVFYGPPYNPMWWWVMGGLIIAAAFIAVGLVPVFEWILDGYLPPRERD